MTRTKPLNYKKNLLNFLVNMFLWLGFFISSLVLFVNLVTNELFLFAYENKEHLSTKLIITACFGPFYIINLFVIISYSNIPTFKSMILGEIIFFLHLTLLISSIKSCNNYLGVYNMGELVNEMRSIYPKTKVTEEHMKYVFENSPKNISKYCKTVLYIGVVLSLPFHGEFLRILVFGDRDKLVQEIPDKQDNAQDKKNKKEEKETKEKKE